jgi:hypothetical protein
VFFDAACVARPWRTGRHSTSFWSKLKFFKNSFKYQLTEIFFSYSIRLMKNKARGKANNGRNVMGRKNLKNHFSAKLIFLPSRPACRLGPAVKRRAGRPASQSVAVCNSELEKGFRCCRGAAVDRSAVFHPFIGLQKIKVD